MKSMVRKAKDNSGATIIMALLFMLICVVVSTVLLAAAGTVSRDVSRQREQQQAYLAVSSAVNFIKNDICNCKFLKDTAQIAAVNDDPDTQQKMAFSGLLSSAVSWDMTTGPFTANFDLSFNENSLKGLDVSVKFTMDASYAITATCTAYKDGEDGAAERPVAYRMTAKINGEEDEDSIIWKPGSVSKGG